MEELPSDQQNTYDSQVNLSIFNLINIRFEEIHSSLRDAIRAPKASPNILARKRKCDALFNWAEKKWNEKGLVWDNAAREFIPVNMREEKVETEVNGSINTEAAAEGGNSDEDNNRRKRRKGKGNSGDDDSHKEREKSKQPQQDLTIQTTTAMTTAMTTTATPTTTPEPPPPPSRRSRRPRQQAKPNKSLSKHLSVPKVKPNSTSKNTNGNKTKNKYKEPSFKAHKTEMIYFRPLYKLPLKKPQRPIKKYRLSLDRLILLCQKSKITKKLKQKSSNEIKNKTQKDLELEPLGKNWRGVLLRRNVVKTRRWEKRLLPVVRERR